MKTKSIKRKLREVTDQWIASVDDDNLKNVIRDEIIITGGAIVSMLTGKEVNDYDVYFRTWQACHAVAKYYVDRFNKDLKDPASFSVAIDSREFGRVRLMVRSAGIAKKHVESKMKFHPVCLTSNAITLSDKIQLITRFIGEPDEIHKFFDFIHCRCYWTSWNNELVLPPEALVSILTKDLIYYGSKYPIASIVRIRKFVKRGWSITAGQILKIAMQISELDLQDLDVLEDQLTGVDLAYFGELIAKLRHHDPDKVDTAYVVKLIEEIFEEGE